MIPTTNQKFGNPNLNPENLDLNVDRQIIEPQIEQPIIESKEQVISNMNDNNTDQKYYDEKLNSQFEEISTEEVNSPIILEKKLETNLVKQLLTQTLEGALHPPPDPIKEAMEGAVAQAASQFAQNMFIPNAGNVQQVVKKGIFVELMNTAFGHGLGENIGNQLPNIIQSLTGVIGQEKTKELVENFNSNNNNNEVDLEKEKQKDNVLALNSENPEQVRQYAVAMGLSDTAAKSILITHQTDIKNERQGNSQNQNNVPNNVPNNEIAEAMTTLIDTVVQMQNTMTNMQKELNSVKEPSPKVVEEDKSEIKWDDELNNNPQLNDDPNVTLFETPISVDIDEIQGNNNPFFDKTDVNSVAVQTQPIVETPVVETPVVETPVVEIKTTKPDITEIESKIQNKKIIKIKKEE